jgi:hypothetical protein
MSELVQISRLKCSQKILNNLKYKIYALKEKLSTASIEDVRLLQGEIKGLEWLLNELNSYEKKNK